MVEIDNGQHGQVGQVYFNLIYKTDIHNVSLRATFLYQVKNDSCTCPLSVNLSAVFPKIKVFKELFSYLYYYIMNTSEEEQPELSKTEINRLKHLERMKLYRKNNKQKCAEYQRKYYHRLKDTDPEAYKNMLYRKKLYHEKNK